MILSHQHQRTVHLQPRYQQICLLCSSALCEGTMFCKACSASISWYMYVHCGSNPCPYPTRNVNKASNREMARRSHQIADCCSCIICFLTTSTDSFPSWICQQCRPLCLSKIIANLHHVTVHLCENPRQSPVAQLCPLLTVHDTNLQYNY